MPGSGGRLERLEDFRVEEIPAYLPSGAGEHCMALVEKRGLTTPEAIRRICSACGADPARAGYAGLKDKQGVTRQWISLHGVSPRRVRAVQVPDLQVLQADLHRNKVRTGHLRGNRFAVVLRGTSTDAPRLAEAILDRLTEEGLPNYFGEQRFGRAGDNAEQGRRLLRGEAAAPREKFKRRLLVSAFQSLLFNSVLMRRLQQGVVGKLLGGEVLQRTDSGGLFVSEEQLVDQQRLDAGEVVITGPICGTRMPWPLTGSPARRLEEQILTEHEIGPEDFKRAGRLARGGRRPIAVPVREARVEPIEQGALRLTFTLPAGAYATVLLREVAKRDVRELMKLPVAGG
jgi:tRNA pseudouridine13 synthase